VTVKLHAPDGVPAVAADRRRIARVLRNLTENAAQYTPPQGNVDIRIETQGARVRVEFANDGGELTPADLPYIFERLCRGDKPRSRQKGGAGIGLAIVKELVEVHHGRVGAEISGSQVRCGSGSICRALLLLLLGTVLRKSLHDLYSDVKRPLTSLLTVWTS
jgi:signal transduction histidine kinase